MSGLEKKPPTDGKVLHSAYRTIDATYSLMLQA